MCLSDDLCSSSESRGGNKWWWGADAASYAGVAGFEPRGESPCRLDHASDKPYVSYLVRKPACEDAQGGDGDGEVGVGDGALLNDMLIKAFCAQSYTTANNARPWNNDAKELIVDANSFGGSPTAAMNALRRSGCSVRSGTRRELLDRAAVVWSLSARESPASRLRRVAEMAAGSKLVDGGAGAGAGGGATTISQRTRVSRAAFVAKLPPPPHIENLRPAATRIITAAPDATDSGPPSPRNAAAAAAAAAAAVLAAAASKKKQLGGSGGGGGNVLDVTFIVQYYRRPARIPSLGKSLKAFAAVGEHEVLVNVDGGDAADHGVGLRAS